MGYVCGVMEPTFEEDGWDDYRIDDDHLATCILLGDNFVIFAEEGNEKGANFYILLCTQTYIVQSTFHLPMGATILCR